MSLIRDDRLPADDSNMISLIIPARSCFLAIGVFRAAGRRKRLLKRNEDRRDSSEKVSLVGLGLSERGLARAITFYRLSARYRTRRDPVDNLDILANPVVHPADADGGRQFRINL